MLPLRPPDDLLLDFPPDDCDRPPEDFDFQLPFDWEEWRLPDGVDLFEPGRDPLSELLLKRLPLPSLEEVRPSLLLLALGRPRRPPPGAFSVVWDLAKEHSLSFTQVPFFFHDQQTPEFEVFPSLLDFFASYPACPYLGLSRSSCSYALRILRFSLSSKWILTRHW